MPSGVYKHKPISEETRRRMSEARKKEWADGLRIPTIGGRNSPSWKGGKPKCIVCGKILCRRHLVTSKCISCFGKTKRGKGAYNWLKDRTKLKRYNDDNKDRRSSAYNYWRKSVFERDNFKCQIDNCDCSGKIIAHHILNWSKYPELRYNINNGITLCQAHHPKTRAKEKILISFFKKLVLVPQIKI